MKHWIKILWIRITSVRKDLLLLLSIAFATIFLIEFWLINIPAPNRFVYHFGQFFLKVCYSYFSAFIFYFLVIHIPQELKRAKSQRQLNNKILEIKDHFKEIISLIMNVKVQEVGRPSEKAIKEACKKINPQNPVNIPPYNPPFENWYEYLNFKGHQIRQVFNELLILNSSLDSEVLELLTFVDDETSRFMFVRKQYGNKDLTHIAIRLNTGYLDSILLFSTFRQKYSRYNYEYNRNYRKLNKQRLASP